MPPKNDKLETMRHSAAHLLAAAVLELYPDTKLGVGPVVENGFYYDFEFSKPVGLDAFPKIEKRMREIIKRNEEFRREEMPIDQAIEFFKGFKQKFKVSLLEDLKKRGTTAVNADESQEVDVKKPDKASIRDKR